MSMPNPRVLVADDDHDMLRAVSDALTRLGYGVVCATSGAELVDQLATEGPFDLIVTDLAMPWMDGLKTMRSMRTAGVATPVILMTAVSTRDLAAEVSALGTNATLLRKPFDFDALEQAVVSVTAAPFDRSA